MKPGLIILLLIITNFTLLYSQEKTIKKIPAVEILSFKEKPFNTIEITKENNTVLLIFWASWCKPCTRLLNSLNPFYPLLSKDYNVKIFAISNDNERARPQVKSYILDKKWNFEFLFDSSGDFKRAINADLLPYIYFINKKGEIICEHVGFNEGDEKIFCDWAKKISQGENITNE